MVRNLGRALGAVLFAAVSLLSIEGPAAAADPLNFSALARKDLRSCGGFLDFNCVSSVSLRGDKRHRIEPFQLKKGGAGTVQQLTSAVAWERVRRALEETPRVKIVKSTDTLIRAEVRSSWFGFPDDVELTLRPVSQRIHIRSESRRFPADFGVNRKRVEALRLELSRRGVIE